MVAQKKHLYSSCQRGRVCSQNLTDTRGRREIDLQQTSDISCIHWGISQPYLLVAGFKFVSAYMNMWSIILYEQALLMMFRPASSTTFLSIGNYLP